MKDQTTNTAPTPDAPQEATRTAASLAEDVTTASVKGRLTTIKELTKPIRKALDKAEPGMATCFLHSIVAEAQVAIEALGPAAAAEQERIRIAQAELEESRRKERAELGGQIPGTERKIDLTSDCTISVNGGPRVPLAVATAALDVIQGRKAKPKS